MKKYLTILAIPLIGFSAVANADLAIIESRISK